MKDHEQSSQKLDKFVRYENETKNRKLLKRKTTNGILQYVTESTYIIFTFFSLLTVEKRAKSHPLAFKILIFLLHEKGKMKVFLFFQAKKHSFVLRQSCYLQKEKMRTKQRWSHQYADLFKSEKVTTWPQKYNSIMSKKKATTSFLTAAVFSCLGLLKFSTEITKGFIYLKQGAWITN